MIIKKFYAATMKEALVQIKSTLGEDAVILKSRKVNKGGLLNIFSKEVVEVTAATPDSNPIPRGKVEFSNEMKEAISRASQQFEKAELEKKVTEDVPKTRKENPGNDHRINNYQNIKSSTEKEKKVDPAINELALSSINKVRVEVSELNKKINDLSVQIKHGSEPNLPDIFKTAWNNLLNNGIEERLTNELIHSVHAEMQKHSSIDEKLIHQELIQQLIARFKTSRINSYPVSVAMIGPTGVGKTTTLAKMATNRNIFGQLKVGLISTDTYRIAALEQLRTFASIAGIPMEVVYRPEDLPKMMELFSDKDVILIDTAGRSQNDKNAIYELRDFMDIAQPDEIMLALSAGTRVEDQKSIIKRFSEVEFSQIVLTKIDEISSTGHLLEIAQLIDLPWSYITTGQNVPDDIIQVNSEFLAEMVSSKKRFFEIGRNNFAI